MKPKFDHAFRLGTRSVRVLLLCYLRGFDRIRVQDPTPAQSSPLSRLKRFSNRVRVLSSIWSSRVPGERMRWLAG
jgi:hypothetical protein